MPLSLPFVEMFLSGTVCWSKLHSTCTQNFLIFWNLHLIFCLKTPVLRVPFVAQWVKGIATAMAQVSSDLIPGLGTSICCKCSQKKIPKTKQKNNQKTDGQTKMLWSSECTASSPQLVILGTPSSWGQCTSPGGFPEIPVKYLGVWFFKLGREVWGLRRVEYGWMDQHKLAV